MRARFFRSPAEFRRWLRLHHAHRPELWVGLQRQGARSARLTWPQAVEEALCFGWIDGLRHRVDATRYAVRFTPRRPGSIWSAVNIATAEMLIAAGRMASAGARAYAQRRHNRAGGYSYERRPRELPEPYRSMLRLVPQAQRFFAAQIPSYRRAATWWVLSAKQQATRLRRAAALVEHCRQRRLIPQFLPRR